MPAGFRWPVALRRPLRVESRALEDYVTPVWDEELAQTVRNRVRAAGLSAWGGSYPQLYFSLDAVPVPIAYEVYVRPRGQVAYEALPDSFGLAKVLLASASAFRGYAGLPCWLEGEPAAIDVQLRPSPENALLHGWESCFNGAVEWEDLPMRDDEHVYPPEHQMAPTRVFRWDVDSRE
jgi:hypothetical protein